MGEAGVDIIKGTGHNKFVRRGPTLSGVGGYRTHYLSHEHYSQNFIDIKKYKKYSASKSQHC